jgi:DNA (cytosine-5)-methyltransferase 1
MAEINALPWNGFNVVSTFAGCGGSSTGYRMAGYRVLWANELVEVARDSYRANARKETILDGRSIRDITPQDILKATRLGVGEIDIFDGSPPCTSFSTSGARSRLWGVEKRIGGVSQRDDDLFFDYIRLVDGVRPKVFLAENVGGMVIGASVGIFIEVMKSLKSIGYNVETRLLDGQWLGIPQARKRLIFIGVRNDLNLRPSFPKPLRYRYTISDALPDVEGIELVPTGIFSGRRFGVRSEPITTLKSANLEEYRVTRRSRELAAGDRHLMDGRESTFKISELKRLCGFPDDFGLRGSPKQQSERLGNAVPPVMMGHVAAAIRDNVLCMTTQ